MIINKIIIKNYGIYYKENVYDFSVEDNGKNVILINGKNGSGKTTLLESIKLSLYGSLFHGLKHPNKKYYEAIHKKFNKKALSEGEKESFIEIDFQWNENNDVENYKVKRIWTLKRGELKTDISEKVQIMKNDILLSNKEGENVENYFRKVFPQKIFDFFFFDGEDVKKLISSNYLEHELKDAVYTLFDIDIFKSLGLNLESYMKNRSKNNDLTLEEEKFLKITESKDKILRHIEEHEKKITELKIEEEETQIQIKKLNDRFKYVGGDIYNKRGEIEKNILELEYNKNKNAEKLKNYLANEIPLLINKNALISVINQLKKEDSLKEFEVISNKVNDGTIGNILRDTFQKKNINNEEIEEFKMSLLKSFNKEKIIKLHNLSYDESQRVKSSINHLENLSIEKDLKDRKKMLTEISTVKKELNEIKNNNEIEEILKEIERLNVMNQKTTLEIFKIDDIIKIENDKLFQVELEIKELTNKIINSKKNKNKFTVVSKVQKVLNDFIYIKNTEKIEKVKKVFLETFNSLHRKRGFIESVEINPETLEIKLKHKYGPLDNDLLSAGEKQIYILSLLFAFLKVSGKELPLVFDTLLGRLDEDHRANIIRSYLPKASKQVLILSTDSEVKGENYKLIKPYLAKEYTINYDIESQVLTIDNHEGE